jgi:hypothetical protein
MFKFIFIPADSSELKELTESMDGGLEKDRLRLKAEIFFSKTTVSGDLRSAAINESLLKQGIEPSSIDQNMQESFKNLSSGVEIITLSLPSKSNNFVGVSMYCDKEGCFKKLDLNNHTTISNYL